jgi:hypothetical protein
MTKFYSATPAMRDRAIAISDAVMRYLSIRGPVDHRNQVFRSHDEHIDIALRFRALHRVYRAVEH